MIAPVSRLVVVTLLLATPRVALAQTPTLPADPHAGHQAPADPGAGTPPPADPHAGHQQPAANAPGPPPPAAEPCRCGSAADASRA